jgi:OOP family OmpA-OmpF porin
MKLRYFTALLCLGLSATAQADDSVFDFGFGHSFIDMDWDSDRHLDDSNVVILTAAYHANEQLSAELFYADVDSKMSLSGESVDGNQMGLKGLYHLTDRANDIVPYIGFGFAEVELNGGDFERLGEFGLVYVAGLKFKLHERLALRLEANFDHFDESHDSDTLVWAGFSFSFGGRAKTTPPIIVQSKPPINDPVIEPVAAAPAAPTILPPADGDHDGVIDEQDRCADTPTGLKVSEDGCATLTEKASVALNVVFDSGKATFANADAEINRVVAFMNQYPNTQAVIEGHTDASGDDKKNKALSQRRADATRAYLTGRGIPDGVIASEAFGESRPRVETADGVRELQNRRVEIMYGPGSGM